jgi:hypothetical protein
MDAIPLRDGRNPAILVIKRRAWAGTAPFARPFAESSEQPAKRLETEQQTAIS